MTTMAMVDQACAAWDAERRTLARIRGEMPIPLPGDLNLRRVHRAVKADMASARGEGCGVFRTFFDDATGSTVTVRDDSTPPGLSGPPAATGQPPESTTEITELSETYGRIREGTLRARAERMHRESLLILSAGLSYAEIRCLLHPGLRTRRQRCEALKGAGRSAGRSVAHHAEGEGRSAAHHAETEGEEVKAVKAVEAVDNEHQGLLSRMFARPGTGSLVLFAAWLVLFLASAPYVLLSPQQQQRQEHDYSSHIADFPLPPLTVLGEIGRAVRIGRLMAGDLLVRLRQSR